MADLDRLLFDDKVSLALRSELGEIRRQVINAVEESPFADAIRQLPHWQRSFIVQEASGNACREGLRSVFKKRIFDHLDQPYVITLEDCCSAFAAHLLVPDDEFAKAYRTSFAGHLHHLSLLGNASEPTAIAVGPFKPWDQNRKVTVWEKDDFHVNLAGTVSEDYITTNGIILFASRTVFAYVEATCSPLAFADAKSVLIDGLKTGFRSVQLICENDERLMTIRGQEPSGIEIVDGDGKLNSDFSWLREFLRIFCGRPKRKGSMDQRIRNAMHLLIDADRQSNDAVALALSMSALEALLGDGRQEVSASLRERCAVLLEPVREQRTNLENLVKKLYDLRSRMLHGDTVETGPEARIHARTLAAGILKAVVEWITYKRRFDGRDDEKTESPHLVQSLQTDKYKAGLPDGVLPSPVSSLWRK